VNKLYPSSPTETEILNKKITDDAPKTEDVIRDYIEAHRMEIPKMQEGIDYYFAKGKISKRVIEVYGDGGAKSVDPDATNNKIPSGWHKLLVDQKVSYLVGDAITIASKTEKDIKAIQEALGEEFEDTMPELVKNASNKGRDWLHPYIDEEGKFDYIIIPAEEFIPIYDNNKRKHLQGGIRFYSLDDETTKIEVWDENVVTYYEMVNGEVVKDALEEINPASHFYYNDKGYGWGKVPFVEFANNEERVSDLIFYKNLIDCYDLLMSDVSNTLEDIQSFIYVLKGYEGTDLKQFTNDVKRYKVISMSDEQGSGVDTINAEVPVEAVKTHLERLAQDIYAFGQGVNSSPDKFGNAPSGVAIKNLYSLLDMKASMLERKFSKGLEKFIWFVCEYLSISGQGDFDYKDLTFTFNKSLLVNEMEIIQMAQQSQGLVSRLTILRNHPWVDNPTEEEKRLESEMDEYAKHLPAIGGKQNNIPKSGSTTDGKKACSECDGSGKVTSDKTGDGSGKVTSDKTGERITCKTCGGDGVIG
jgi:SPP1 family phage portal protein